MVNRRKGSVTVETAAVLPFFVALLVFIMFFFRILQVQTCVAQALNYTGRKIAAESSLKLEENDGTDAAGLLGSASIFQKELKKLDCPTEFIRGGKVGISLLQSDLSGDYVELKATYYMKFPIRLIGNVRYQVAQGVVCRKWTGYHLGQDDQVQDDWLYYTQYGTVYHTSRNCSYLDLSIQGIPGGTRNTARNAGGGKYHACPYCGNQNAAGGMVYITNYGDCYHTSLACSGLKRTIHMIRRSKATDKHLCSKCGH